MEAVSISAEQLAQAKTWTGVAVDDIPKVANAKYPKSAYEKISEDAGAAVKGKTDIKFPYVRRRIERIFGTQGFGWRLVPDAQFGKIEAVEMARRGDKGEFQEVTVNLIGHVFEYALVVPGVPGLQWVRSSIFSDAHTGRAYKGKDRSYIQRGAWTSLLKQVLRSFGGFDHVYKTEPENLAEPEDEGKAVTTGLSEITASTPISAAKWSWLSAEGCDRIWSAFGSKTFGDLPPEVTGYLVTRPTLPPELDTYLSNLKPAQAAGKAAKAPTEGKAKPASAAAERGNGQQ